MQGIGYRDFEEGVESAAMYLKKLKDSNVTVLCANADVKEEPSLEGLFVPSLVVTVSQSPERKIGIIGFIGTDADVSHSTTSKLRIPLKKD